MPEATLILRRNPDAKRSEGYDVFFEGRHGRIYEAVSHAPRETPCGAVQGPIRVLAADPILELAPLNLYMGEIDTWPNDWAASPRY
jgi:hypothetical protein